jgi:hypothetical protein
MHKAKKFLGKVAAAATGVMATAGAALADGTGITVDYSGATSGLMAQAQSAITAALPIIGALLGVGVAIKLYKRFAK